MSEVTKNWGADHLHAFMVAAASASEERYVNRANIRCIKRLHPGFYLGVESTRGTILRDGTEIPNHDGWNCLEDLEREGLLTLAVAIEDGERMFGRHQMDVRVTDAGLLAYDLTEGVLGEQEWTLVGTEVSAEDAGAVFDLWLAEGVFAQTYIQDADDVIPETDLDPLN